MPSEQDAATKKARYELIGRIKTLSDDDIAAILKALEKPSEQEPV